MLVNYISVRTNAIRFISISSSPVPNLAFKEYFLIANPTEGKSEAMRGRNRDCVKLRQPGNKARIHFQSAREE